MGFEQIFSESLLTAVIIVVMLIIVALAWTFVRAKVTNMAAPPAGPTTVIIANPGALQAQKSASMQTQSAPPTM